MTTANWKPMHMFVSVNNGERGVFGLIELWVVASSPLSKEINTWKKKNGSEPIPSQYKTVNPKPQIKNIQTKHTLHLFTSTYIHGHIPTRIAIPKPTAKQP